MGSNSGMAKIAKFLLGTANRLPERASLHFHGYAVLVIGAEKGLALGIPRGTEEHDLGNSILSYVGYNFPGFELGRITIDDDNEVLFIIGYPPKDGQPIFPCHKSLQNDKGKQILKNGAVYVRVDSSTREARAPEVQDLVERSRVDSSTREARASDIRDLVERSRTEGKPPIDLAVDLTGPINQVSNIDAFMDKAFQIEESRFMRSTEDAEESISPVVAALYPDIRDRKSLTISERDEALNKWKGRKEEIIEHGREYFLGVVLPGSGLRVISHGRYISKPHLTVIFHSCAVYDYLDPAEPDFEKIIEPVIEKPFYQTLSLDVNSWNVRPMGYPVSWNNEGNDAFVKITPDSFHPEEPWESDHNDYVIVARDPAADTVKVSWTLTEEGNNEPTFGEFDATIHGKYNVRDLYRQYFYDDANA
jgi:hypothetical protein